VQIYNIAVQIVDSFVPDCLGRNHDCANAYTLLTDLLEVVMKFAKQS
jgi:hypothetical protein